MVAVFLKSDQAKGRAKKILKCRISPAQSARRKKTKENGASGGNIYRIFGYENTI